MSQQNGRLLSRTVALLGMPLMLISTSTMGYGYGMHYMPPMPPAPPAMMYSPGMMSYGMRGHPTYGAPTQYRGYATTPAASQYTYGYAQPEKAKETREEASVSGDIQVSIAQMRFEPAEVQITAGDTVTWRNSGAAPHTVTGSNGGPSSGTLRNSQMFSHTFDTAGTYEYYCAIHPGMTGKVVVQ